MQTLSLKISQLDMQLAETEGSNHLFCLCLKLSDSRYLFTSALKLFYERFYGNCISTSFLVNGMLVLVGILDSYIVHTYKNYLSRYVSSEFVRPFFLEIFQVCSTMMTNTNRGQLGVKQVPSQRIAQYLIALSTSICPRPKNSRYC